MCQLALLKEIDLSWNYLSGVFPIQLYDLKSLNYLSLQGNADQGLCNHTNGAETYASSVGLEGNILGPGIQRLAELKKLEVYTNDFGDEISSEIGKLEHLGMFIDYLSPSVYSLC
jgi:hypothetical protein